MRKSKSAYKQNWLRILTLISLGAFVGSSVSAEEILCDALGDCLSSAEAANYHQAEAHISIENWQEANDLLGELYVEALQSEDSMNFLVLNNYAVTLAKTGRPAVAALVLEKFFKELPGVGPGFQNLMQTYEFIADSAEPGATPAVDLMLIDPEPRLERRVSQASSFGTDELGTADLDSAINAALDGEITSRLHEYLNAWKTGDVSIYLGFYTPGHSPIDSLDYEDWLAQRRVRVRPDKDIELRITDLRIRHETNRQVTAEFTQDYRSIYYRDSSRKKLTWIQNDAGSWTIQHEESVL